jgi:hypothetical protein
MVYENGAKAGVSFNVIMLLWYNGLIFQQNNACATYAWEANTGTWSQTIFPGGFTPPPAVGYTCPGLGGVWTSSSGEKLYSSNQYPLPNPATWWGQIDFYYDAVCSGGGSASYAGNLSLSQSTIGENPLYVSGPSTNTENGQADSYSTFTYTGQLSPGVSLALTGVDCLGNPLTTNWTYDGALYNKPASLALIAGNWATLPNGGTLAIDSNGNITIPDIAQTVYAGCTASGTVTIPNPNYNLYAFTMSFSGCGSGPYEHGNTVTGLLTIDSTAAPAVLEGGAIWDDDDGGAGNTDFYLIRQ